MTQALSLSQILRDHDHEVVQVVVGKSPKRKIPSFFEAKIQAPLAALESPNFVTDKQHRSVKPLRTVVYSLLKSRKYRTSIDRIHELVEATQPDVIVNFYDFLGGLYNYFYRPKARFIVLAHQYLLSHPEFTFPTGRKIDKISLLIANRITRLGADQILALSFQYFDDLPKKKLTIVPPLIRKEVKKQPIIDQGHLLIYMVNPGYSAEVERFHTKHPNIPLHCFWDKNDQPEVLKKDNTLTFHQLNDQKFIEKMASCRGYVTTAGFESVCEAMYLGKPALMIPVAGHYEQSCNAIDGQKAGAGIPHDEFDLSVLIDYLPHHIDVSARFRKWADSYEKIFLKALTN